MFPVTQSYKQLTKRFILQTLGFMYEIYNSIFLMPQRGRDKYKLYHIKKHIFNYMYVIELWWSFLCLF